MVLRVEAGITILKPPTVGKEVSWIALSVMRYGGLIQCEESFLIIYRGYHDTTSNRYPSERRKNMSLTRVAVVWGRSAERCLGGEDKQKSAPAQSHTKVPTLCTLMWCSPERLGAGWVPGDHTAPPPMSTRAEWARSPKWPKGKARWGRCRGERWTRLTPVFQPKIAWHGCKA